MNKPWEIDWDAPWMQPWGSRDAPTLPEPAMPDDPNTAFGFNSIQAPTPGRIEQPVGYVNTPVDPAPAAPAEYADEAKAERGFGRSAYMNGLTGDLPDLSETRQPLNIPATPAATDASREADPFRGKIFQNWPAAAVSNSRAAQPKWSHRFQKPLPSSMPVARAHV